MRLRARAPGKVNLCLFLGPVRDDGRHELVTVFESVSLADEVEMCTRAALSDQVVCPGVDEPNIVTRALEELRGLGWDAPAVQVRIDKRIPVAAGMGGGSADAAAVLRMAQRLSPLTDDFIGRLAARLGADVPSQLAPGVILGTGAGDVVSARPPLPAHAFLILPIRHRLSTADVYAEADRLGLARTSSALRTILPQARSDVASMLINDLADAAVSLCPAIRGMLEAAREAGADHAFVCGSGPTVAGLFWGEDGFARARAAALMLAERYPDATAALPVRKEFGFPVFA